MRVLAVDGGNTKTTAVVMDETGAVLGAARGGTGDIYGGGGESGAIEVVTSTIALACRRANTDEGDLDHAMLHLAGVDWDEDEALWREVADERWPGSRVTIRNDGCALLRCASLDGRGISVVLGTGGALAGAGPAGEKSLSFWLQHPLGAAGLVDQAIRSAVLAETGLGPATRLREVIPELMGCADVASALQARTRRHTQWTWPRMASLAPGVMALWGSDDEVDRLVAEMAEHLSRYVTHLAQACGLEQDFTVALGGGLVRSGSPLADLLTDGVNRAHPEARVVQVLEPAVFGVALDALAEAGAGLSSDVCDRLRAGMAGAPEIDDGNA